jgi:molybdopterin-binding protein
MTDRDKHGLRAGAYWREKADEPCALASEMAGGAAREPWKTLPSCTTGWPSRRSGAKRRMEVTVKISARNQIKGRIVRLKKGAMTSHVQLDVLGTVVTASITNEAVEELRLAVGQDAYALVKASDVIIGIEG